MAASTGKPSIEPISGPSESHTNGNGGSGGIAIFCKTNISSFITPVHNNNDDVIWIKLIGKFLETKMILIWAHVISLQTATKIQL